MKYTEWQQIEQYFPACKRGRPRKWEMWLIINAILYVTRTGCQWRTAGVAGVPTHLPPWQTVHGYFWRWTRSGRWEPINAMLVRQARQQAGRNPQPSAASSEAMVYLASIRRTLKVVTTPKST